MDAIASEWRELCDEGPCNQPFFRPEWIAASIQAFAPNHRVLLVTLRDRGRLRAVLPLLEEKKSFWGIRFTKFRGAANVQHSCRFDLVCGNHPDPNEIVHVMWHHLEGLPDWDVIELPLILQGGPAEQLVKRAQAHGFLTFCYEQRRSPYISLDRSAGTDFSAQGFRAHFKQNLQRRRRKLEAHGPLSLRREDRADQASLQTFYGLEQAGWKGKIGTAIACSAETRQFYDSVAQSAENFGYLSLYFLQQGNSVIAAHFGLTLGARYWVLKVGYDEDYAKYGPGHLLMGAVLRECAQRGLTEVDLLGHSATWKAEWAFEARPHMISYIFRKHVKGRLLEADIRQTHKLQAAIGSVMSKARGLPAQIVHKTRQL